MFPFFVTLMLSKKIIFQTFGNVSLTTVIHQSFPHEILVKDPGFSRKVKEAFGTGYYLVLNMNQAALSDQLLARFLRSL